MNLYREENEIEDVNNNTSFILKHPFLLKKSDFFSFRSLDKLSKIILFNKKWLEFISLIMMSTLTLVGGIFYGLINSWDFRESFNLGMSLFNVFIILLFPLTILILNLIIKRIIPIDLPFSSFLFMLSNEKISFYNRKNSYDKLKDLTIKNIVLVNSYLNSSIFYWKSFHSVKLDYYLVFESPDKKLVVLYFHSSIPIEDYLENINIINRNSKVSTYYKTFSNFVINNEIFSQKFLLRKN